METERKTVDYHAVLADLEAKKDELDHAIIVIKRIMGEPVSPLETDHARHAGQTHSLTPTAFFSMSVADAAKMYLGIVKEPKTTPDIAQALQDHGLKTVAKDFTVTVYSALDRRFKDIGDIVRPKRGLWGLSEWYPGLRKERKENGDKKGADVGKDQKPNEPTPADKLKEANRRGVGTAYNSGHITAGEFEDYVRQKPRRMKDVLAKFGVAKEAVTKLLNESTTNVHVVGIGWLKIQE